MVCQFELPPKVYVALEMMGVETLGQLADMERSRIFKYRNMGEKSVHQLDKILSTNGLSWKKEEPKMKPVRPPKPPEEIEITRRRRDVQAHNGMLVAEVEKLTGELIKVNLEKVRMEGRIKELEEKAQRLADLVAMK